ncbi:MAG: hypothetical protein KDJ65_17960 [Anaerolineae bacterium]|nr:hypothetical protein [Anaerolineae bacterium]
MIRSFHLRDSRLVARLQKAGTPLDIEEQLTHPRSPLRSVFLDTFLSPQSGPSTFILNHKDEQHGKQLGLAQIRTRPGRPERDVVFMSPTLNSGNGSHAIWQRLLTHLCVQTAESGTLRIYARLPLHTDELQIFKNVGFVEYSQEHFYQLDPSVDRTEIRPQLELRLQQASDGWGLQKLYATLTPRAVQNAEGLAQGQWELYGRRWGVQGRRTGYVWEYDGDILGALHIRNGKRGYSVRTLLHPDALDKAEALCQAALRLTATKPKAPVYFAFRAYESGWQHILPMFGFKPLTSQVLVTKPMAVRIREKSTKLIPALEASPTEGAASTTIISHAKSKTTVSKNGSPHRRRKTTIPVL